MERKGRIKYRGEGTTQIQKLASLEFAMIKNGVIRSLGSEWTKGGTSAALGDGETVVETQASLQVVREGPNRL